MAVGLLSLPGGSRGLLRHEPHSRRPVGNVLQREGKGSFLFYHLTYNNEYLIMFIKFDSIHVIKGKTERQV